MEDFECGKKTRRKLRLNELKSVQVDTTDPIATAFSSGQYGHGSRVFAKVVETVIARLETRIAGAGGEHAAAAAVAGKVNKAWREKYNRPLPSEAKVQQELLKFSRRDIKLLHGREQVGPVSAITNLGSSKPILSSDRWYAAAPTAPPRPVPPRPAPQSATTSRKRPRETADRRPKRRFVLKVAAAAAAAAGTAAATTGGAKRNKASGNRSTSAGSTRTTRRPTGGVAVAASVNGKTGGRKQGAAAVAGTPGRIAGGVRAGGALGTTGLPAATAGAASAAATVGEGRVEGDGGGDGGVELGADKSRTAVRQRQAVADEGQENEAAGGGEEKRAAAAAAAENAGNTGSSGAEPRAVEDATEDLTLRPTPACPPSSNTSTSAAATPHAEGTGGGGEEPSREEEKGSRRGSDSDAEESKSGEPGSGTKICDNRGGGGGGDTETSAGKKNNGEGGADKGEDASAVVDGGEVGISSDAAAAPDVILTANYLGECQKGRARRKWVLDLEGGAIEGEGQVFVFDKCECWMIPPPKKGWREE